MAYRYLSEQLWPVAEACARYFEENWGVSRFKSEEPIDEDIERRPTLQAMTTDKHLLCIEVSENPYPTGMDSFVLDCMSRFLPVRLYVGVPAGSKDTNHKRDTDRARERGVGVVEVSEGRVQIVVDALSLSLAGVRPIDPGLFPRKYRLSLSNARSTFRNGDPAKGCSILYDEIEALTRKIARKTYSKGLWKVLKHGAGPQKPNFDTEKWGKLIGTLMDRLDHKKCKGISRHMLGRVLGITPHRNESAHKPKTLAELVKRDRELRTRFESAADLLLDLINAGKPLRI